MNTFIIFGCKYLNKKVINMTKTYRYYQQEVRRIKTTKGLSTEKVVYLTKKNVEKTTEGEVLDNLGLTNVCCRRHMLTHVDIE